MQDVTHDGSRLVVLRQRVAERSHAGGKQLLEVPGYKFQALRTNLPPSISALEVWRRYNGRADIENRIKELGTQFGLKGLCCRSFWATEAACHLAICAYNLCVGAPAPVRSAPARGADHPALAPVCLRGGLQPRQGPTHPQTRRRWPQGQTLVARSGPATCGSGTQLRCSCRPLRQSPQLSHHLAFNCMSPAKRIDSAARRLRDTTESKPASVLRVLQKGST